MTEVQISDPTVPRIGPPIVPDGLEADAEQGSQADASPTASESVGTDPAAGRRTIEIPDIPYRRLAGFALVGAGGLLVAFLLYLYFFTPLTASRNQQRLAQSLVGQPLAVFRLVNGPPPREGSAVAVLEIPELGVHQIVVQGTSAADLMNGPGLMPGTALPGTVGNAVIAGRRTTFGGPFGAIGSLKKGEQIHVVDGAGTFNYRVTRVFTVAEGKQDVVLPSTHNRLTLVTANSSFYPTGRLVVQASLVGTPYADTGVVVTIPSYELGLSGDAAAGGLAVLWSLITVIVLVAAAFAVWRWRRPWIVYLFTAPVLMMCGLFACESVARALPATL
jgi:sortase A